MTNYNKIHIYLRQFSRLRNNPDRPKWFSPEKVFLNLLKTSNKEVCELTICFEHEEDYPSHFTKNYENTGFNLKFIDTKNIKRKTLFDEPWSHSVAATSEIILKDIESGKIKENELIYILEEDYLHLPNWAEMTLDFFNTSRPNLDYVCLYDHNDKYIFRQTDETIKQYNLEPHWGMYRDLKSEIIVSNYRHWRSLPNCGLSMIFTKDLFLRDKELWLTGNSDCEIGFQLNTKHGTKFWTPIPSVSCHVINPFCAPLIPWEKVIDL